jgi:hypothetical protein
VPPFVEIIFPCCKLHLIAGASNAGKTRLMVPALMMCEAGLPFLGFRSHPMPWCWVAGERPLSDSLDTIGSMGFTPDMLKVIPAFGRNHKTRAQIMAEIERIGAKVVLWEGFDSQVKNPNNPSAVHEFLNEITGYCEEGLTIIGDVGGNKNKDGEIYPNPRNNIPGHANWERSTSTNLFLHQPNPGDLSDPHRTLYVSVKNGISFGVPGKFNGLGMLEFEDYRPFHNALDPGNNVCLRTRIKKKRGDNST